MSKKKLPKQKKVPERTCVACKTKSSKFNMIRVVRVKDGEVFVDGTGKVRGRGANLCENLECFEKAIRKGLLENALSLNKHLSDSQITSLRKDFKEVIYNREFRKGNQAVKFRVKKDDLIDVLAK